VVKNERSDRDGGDPGGECCDGGAEAGEISHPGNATPACQAAVARATAASAAATAATDTCNENARSNRPVAITALATRK
jgi:hypothetical protein